MGLKLGSETGSLQNHLYSRMTVGAPEPEVGRGATILHYTDRTAGTIVKVTRTQIHVQEDTTTRTDSNGMSESQAYTYAPNPEGRIHVFRHTKRGFRSADGHGLLIGIRQHYYDYSF